VSSAEICLDYSRDIESAAADLRRDLVSQVADLTNIANSGKPPADDLAKAVGQRRDDLVRTAMRIERSAPCPEANAGRDRYAVVPQQVRLASAALDVALDGDNSTDYRTAEEGYRMALTSLTTAAPPR
jgi:hypothetical protein